MIAGRWSILAMLAAVVWVSDAGAQSWRRVQGIDSTRGVYALASHGGAYYAVSDTLVYRSADGLNWQVTAAQPPAQYGGYTLFSHTSGLYLGTVLDGVSRTTDGGQTWHRPAAGLTTGSVLAFTALGDTLFAGTGDQGVLAFNWKSSASWFPYNTGLSQVGTNALFATPDRLIASVGAYTFARPRGSSQWTQTDMNESLFQPYVFDFIGLGAYVFAGTDDGVFRTPSTASAWQRADIAGMTGKNIQTFALQGSRLFAGLNYQGQHWIWSTDNAGGTWDVRAHEFAEIWDLMIVGNRMWAARQDGLWYYDLDPVSIRRAPRAGMKAAPIGLRGRMLNGRRLPLLP